jgi:hypothetical protein
MQRSRGHKKCANKMMSASKPIKQYREASPELKSLKRKQQIEHREIRLAMLSTSLAPDEFLMMFVRSIRLLA